MPPSFDPSLPRKLEAGIESGLLRHLHSVLISHHGKLALETYYTGNDENWGSPLGSVAFGPETLHDLRSVTKSVVSLLYRYSARPRAGASARSPAPHPIP